MKRHSIALITMLLFALTPESQAAVDISSQSSTGTDFPGTAWANSLSGSDLINAGQPTLASATVTPTHGAFPAEGINDGTSTNGIPGGNTFFSVADPACFSEEGGTAVATYDLNVSTESAGYDITSIQSVMGWVGQASQAQANQTYTVAVSVVGSADYTDIATVSYTPFADVNGANYESRVVITENHTGILASGVDSIRFTFLNPLTSIASGSGDWKGTVVREIDVRGSSTRVVITPQSSSGTAFANTPWAGNLAGTDLINAGQASLAAATVSTAFFGPNGINNGSSIGDTASNTFFSAPGNFPATATYVLDVSTNTAGYDITSIESFMGWNENSATHANQTYTVAVSYVGSADFSDIVTVSYSPFGTANSVHHESHVLINKSSGALATGVDSIRFIFVAPASGGAYPGTVVREIDVHGYPTGIVPAPAITITKPVSRQVIQRGTANSASVAVSGSYSGTPDSIEARMVVMPGAGNSGSDTAWTTIAAAPAGGTFAANLTDVPAGGWYQLEVRPVSAGTPDTASVVERIGIGDIYVTCGQSNAANYGSPAGTVSDDRVSAWNYADGAWSKAADPMPGATGSGGSVWSRLGDLLATRDGVPIGFACLAVGGSAVSEWLPPNNNYPRISAAMHAFPVNGLRGVLWHQGESDSLASTTPAEYQSRLQSIIAQSRADAGWTVPWHLAEVGFHPSSSLSQEEPVVAGQRRVIYADSQVLPGPVTDDFHLEGKLSDGVHFNAAGLADHAAQWAEVLAGTAPLAPKNGDFESNPALVDGGIATIDPAAVSSPSVIGWRVLAASGEAVADEGYGYYNPSDSFYSGAADGGGSGGVLPNMSGRHVAFFSYSSANAHFLQTRRALLAPGCTYRLTVALGVRSNANTFGGATLELLADGVVLASRTVSRADLDSLNAGNAAGTFTDVALELSTGSSVAAGQPLALRIRHAGGTGTYLDFDNVRLIATPTPYTAWQIDHWGGTADAAAAWSANPDGDMFANGLEYYLGGDPEKFDAALSLTSSSHDGKEWWRFQVPLDPAVDSAGLEMWYSFDLGTWHPAATNPGGTVLGNRTNDSWSLEVSATDHVRAFFRLNSGTQPD